MNIYEIDTLEMEIDRIASENEGEILEELMNELVEKQTRSLEQMEKLVQYTRRCEMFIDACKDETKRINELKSKIENRITSIKKYLTPYIEKRGKMQVGSFELSTRKSKSVVLDDMKFEKNIEWCEVETTWKPDRRKIKKALESGENISGATIFEKINLQIK